MATYESWVVEEILTEECNLPSELARQVFEQKIRNDPQVDMSRESWRLGAHHGPLLLRLREAIKGVCMTWVNGNPEAERYREAISRIYQTYQDFVIDDLLVKQCGVPPDEALQLFEEALLHRTDVQPGFWRRDAGDPKAKASLPGFIAEVLAPWVEETAYRLAVESLGHATA